MTKHTPGPWRVRLHGDGTSRCSYNGASILGGVSLVASVPRAADKPYDQKAADANLIAAAPELYEASRDYARLIQVERFDRNDIAVHAAYERLRAALAKAEGKS